MLLYPNVKPRYGTPIDRRHPLAQSIGVCLDFNEGQGAPYDASGNATNATINGGVTWSPSGKWGSCLDFNGSTGYLTFPAVTPGITGATAVTISCWAQPTQVSTAATLASNVPTGTPGNGNWYVRFTATGAISFRAYYAASTSVTVTTGATYTANAWHHIAAVLTPATLYIYVDGVQAASAAFGESWTAQAGLWLGADNGSPPGLYWQGYIDSFRLWPRALTAGEIATLYAAPWQILTPDHPYWWPVPHAAAAGVKVPWQLFFSQPGSAA
jgi:Concanavalin A-like lectin/glucanases superfamily